MRTLGAVSVVVPTFNEAENVSLLLQRLDSTFRAAHLAYQVIFIDDRSTDGTVPLLRSLQDKYPLEVHTKQGKQGKAYSLLEGFGYVKYDAICMIDADLQYPPEAIVSMYELMQTNQADIILSRRVDNATSWLRKVATVGYNLVFTRLLFGFDYDTQSGLKLFDRKVLGTINVSPSPWSFDLEFIVRSMEQHYSILSYDIPFAERHAGEAKVNLISTSIELAWAAIKLRIDTSIKDVRRANRRNLQLSEKAFGIFAVTILSALSLAVPRAQAIAITTGFGSAGINLVQILQPQADSPLTTGTMSMQPAATATAATLQAAPVSGSQSSMQSKADAGTDFAGPAATNVTPLGVAPAYVQTPATTLPVENAYVVAPKPDTTKWRNIANTTILIGAGVLAVAIIWYAARLFRFQETTS